MMMTISGLQGVIIIALLIVFIVLTIIIIPFTIYCMIELSAFKKSTHSIQYVDPMSTTGIEDNIITDGIGSIADALSKKDIKSHFDIEDDFLE